MSYVSVELKFNKNTLNKIDNLPDKVVYKIARKTLDYSNSVIPMSRGLSTSGQLRRDTMAYGVHGSDGNYYIGSPTSYANRVWHYNDSTTNWTTPNTHSKWFNVALKRHQKSIVENSINEINKENL